MEREISSRSLIFLAGERQHPTNGWSAEPSVPALGLSLEAAKVMGRKYERVKFQATCPTKELALRCWMLSPARCETPR